MSCYPEDAPYDPWTTGLERDYPEIFARLEHFCQECADAAGTFRVRDKPRAQVEVKTYERTEEHREYLRQLATKKTRKTDAERYQEMIDIMAGKYTATELSVVHGVGVRQYLTSIYHACQRGTIPEQEYKRFMEFRKEQRSEGKHY